MLDARGFSLMEVIVAAIITIVAVLGLAYSFGMGRAFIDRFEVGRLAVATAQARMEQLSVTPAGDPMLVLGVHPASPLPFVWQGSTIGAEAWSVTTFDDPATGTITDDMRKVTVSVRFTVGALRDTIRLEKLFPKP